ncbi:hypothetical protein H5410_008325 [Solanum commersonii]|uniref:Uncharacterized protein n=1 Tax=Solanum commersonii TaxID=4109 RepID=A0A9J6AFF2_SOLCO|nr:hypothetical protein H5410_008325 [Solanum commersonii]
MLLKNSSQGRTLGNSVNQPICSEPRHRHRCRVAAPQEYVEPYPVPQSLWKKPEKTRWTVKKDAGVDFSIDEVIAVTKDGTIRIGMNTGGGVATFADVKAWCAVLATSSVLVEQLEKVYAPLIDGIMYLSALLESH